MATASKVSTMSFKVKTSCITTDYKGSLVEGIHIAFCSVDASNRLTLLNALEKTHQRLTAKEIEKAAA